MRPLLTYLLAVATGATLFNTSVDANNNLFLPGDAFFPTVLTSAELERLKSEAPTERTFTYSSFGGYDPAFCGYAGYERAVIEAVDDDFLHNLAAVYDQVREREPREFIERRKGDQTTLVETNGVRVLFYAAVFKFPRYELGLRYNENWVEEVIKFGHRRDHVRLCCLIPHPEAVMLSWRDATRVAALDVVTPKITLKPVPATETPVTIRGKLKAFVIGSLSLTDLFQSDDDASIDLHVVDSNGVVQLNLEDGEWSRVPQQR